VAFQDVKDWDKAVEAFKTVVAIDALTWTHELGWQK